MNRHWVSVCVLSVGVGVGCTTTPTVMSYQPKGAGALQSAVWPGPPETPRYALYGVLTGEDNFGPSEQSTPSAGERIFRWLVGLGAKLRFRTRELVRPQAGIVDPTGRILVTDVGRQAVFVFDEPAGKLHVWDTADEFSAFGAPVGIALGATDEILVADAELKRIVRLDPQGEPLGSFGGDVLQRPTGLARDPVSGNVYVADSTAHDIKVFDSSGMLVRRIGLRGEGPGEFNGPTHLAYRDNRLYVSDTLNARVQILNAAGEPLATVGKRGLYVGNFTRPKGVTVDRDRNLYVVESYYDHLLIFDDAGRFLLPIGGTGLSIGQFYLPAGVWVDGVDRIFVADMFNGRVIILRYLGAS